MGTLAILVTTACSPLTNDGAAQTGDDGGGGGGPSGDQDSSTPGLGGGGSDATTPPPDSSTGHLPDSSTGHIPDSSTSIPDTSAADTAPPCVQGGASASLPFDVDQYFQPTGWMQAPLIAQTPTCTRPGDDGGSPAKCWAITYTPTKSTDWAGVDWQYPSNNWGTTPGLNVPDGATKLSFYAWGAQGGEIVTFNAGYGATSADGFGATLKNQTLTLTPTQYSIDLTTAAYSCHSVRLGFGWVVAGATPTSFYVDSVTWE